MRAARRAQCLRLLDAGHAERVGLCVQRTHDLDRAVPVTVGLHHREQPRRGRQRARELRVVAQRRQVDEGAGRRLIAGSELPVQIDERAARLADEIAVLAEGVVGTVGVALVAQVLHAHRHAPLA